MPDFIGKSSVLALTHSLLWRPTLVSVLVSVVIQSATPDSKRTPNKLTLGFGTVDVNLTGWRLDWVAASVRDGDLLAVRTSPIRYVDRIRAVSHRQHHLPLRRVGMLNFGSPLPSRRRMPCNDPNTGWKCVLSLSSRKTPAFQGNLRHLSLWYGPATSSSEGEGRSVRVSTFRPLRKYSRPPLRRQICCRGPSDARKQ